MHGGFRALALAGVQVACGQAPTTVSSRAAAVELRPNPVPGVWARNVPKFPSADGTGYHITGECLVCIRAGDGSGLSVLTVQTRVGDATGFDHYNGSPYAAPGTTTCVAQSTVLAVGSFAVDVDVRDDQGRRLRLHADGEVLPPSAPPPAE